MKLGFALAAGVLVWAAFLSQVAPLSAQPAGPATRVLDLDGKDSYVELPPDLFTNQVVTVEGWVKWREFGSYSRFFEFMDGALLVSALNSMATPELAIQRYRTRQFEDQTSAGAPGLLTLNEWHHLAVVAGTNFSRLFFDGALVPTQTVPTGWVPPQLPPQKNYLGRSVFKAVAHDPISTAKSRRSASGPVSARRSKSAPTCFIG